MLEAIVSWRALLILLWILYVPCCIGLIAVVLLQKGKGTGFAGAFGMGGGSDTVFGPRATKSLPVRLTQVMAGMFMVLAFLMSIVWPQVRTGAAPELVEPGAVQDELLLETDDLEDLGIGTAVEDVPVAEPVDPVPIDAPVIPPEQVEAIPEVEEAPPVLPPAPAPDTDTAEPEPAE